MKLFRICSTAVLSLSMAGVLAAQTAQQPPAGQQPPRPTQPTTQAGDAAEMTIVGCLAQSTEDPDDFVLKVTPAGAQTAGGTATTGSDATRATNPTTGSSTAARTSAAGMTNASYKITGIDDAQLKPHVNHQVELKGRVSGSMSSSPSSTASPTTSGGAMSSDMAKEFRASSVRMLSTTCPPAK